ncbi:hypothetical protein [Longimicrobium sp.]|uniref:hypothetical protein n=1 Tax=Longimicrobium sp. TaxID=2029185 RepID=UPI003B3BDFB9
MATIIQRQRIRPTWNGGLRRGRVRNTMAEYVARHPVYLEDVLRIDRELLAMGFEPMPMDRVKRPFDYDRR